MVGAKDLGGMLAMMPGFATDNAGEATATKTVDLERLRAGSRGSSTMASTCSRRVAASAKVTR